MSCALIKCQNSNVKSKRKQDVKNGLSYLSFVIFTVLNHPLIFPKLFLHQYKHEIEMLLEDKFDPEMKEKIIAENE